MKRAPALPPTPLALTKFYERDLKGLGLTARPPRSHSHDASSSSSDDEGLANARPVPAVSRVGVSPKAGYSGVSTPSRRDARAHKAGSSKGTGTKLKVRTYLTSDQLPPHVKKAIGKGARAPTSPTPTTITTASTTSFNKQDAVEDPSPAKKVAEPAPAQDEGARAAVIKPRPQRGSCMPFRRSPAPDLTSDVYALGEYQKEAGQDVQWFPGKRPGEFFFQEAKVCLCVCLYECGA